MAGTSRAAKLAQLGLKRGIDYKQLEKVTRSLTFTTSIVHAQAGDATTSISAERTQPAEPTVYDELFCPSEYTSGPTDLAENFSTTAGNSL